MSHLFSDENGDPGNTLVHLAGIIPAQEKKAEVLPCSGAKYYEDGCVCGKYLYWGNYYKGNTKMRHLICRRPGCKYRSKKIKAGAVKGRVEREWLTTRQR